MLKVNPIADTDSYKLFHEEMHIESLRGMHCYFEARTQGEDIQFFGLQALLKHYFSKPITLADIYEMQDLVPQHVPGKEFLKDGWMHILHEHDGYLPLHIRAVPEGLVVPSGNALFTVESTDPKVPWLPGYVEPIFERLWAPITAGTKSMRIKRLIRSFLERTSDNPDAVIDFMLHDFGARGGQTGDSVAMVGAAHLVNFKGTDTINALRLVRDYYGDSCAGFSVPASEHSVMTALGREGEIEMLQRMLDLYAKPGAIFSVVSDTFDIYNACRFWASAPVVRQLRETGARLVVRPDSGDATEVLPEVYRILADGHGVKVNRKGFEVLNPTVRILQGDGVNENAIGEILSLFKYSGMAGVSAENFVFGMGGELHAKMNRDTHKFAYKCSAQLQDGKWVDIFKDPITDPGKVSKKGRLSLYQMRHGTPDYKTLSDEEYAALPATSKLHVSDVMRTVYENGKFFNEERFSEIRERAVRCEQGYVNKQEEAA